MTKLAIVEEREADKYEHVLSLRHYRPSAAAAAAPGASNAILVPAEGITQIEPHVRALVDGVMKSLSSARQEEIQAWEEELLPCEHTLTLTQLATGHIPPSGECFPPYVCDSTEIWYYARGTRTGALLEMRSQGEPLALPHLWRARLRAQALWRCRRERPRAITL